MGVIATIHGGKMKKTLLLTMLLAGLGATPAYAGYYVSGSVGHAISGDLNYKSPNLIDPDASVIHDSGIALNGAFGYNFGTTRLEAAVGYQENAYNREVDADGSVYYSTWNPVLGRYVSDFHLSALTVMANGYYDFNTVSGIKPYLMAGAGIANFKSGDGWIDDTYFAWQVGAGFGVKIAKNTTFDLGYRYLRPEGLRDLDGWHVNWESHNIMAGIRYDF
ncbi:MAG: porin family protein [Chlorobiaceae bacterium]|nr:porin family protein [Chlorobiaceae bacterium]